MFVSVDKHDNFVFYNLILNIPSITLNRLHDSKNIIIHINLLLMIKTSSCLLATEYRKGVDREKKNMKKKYNRQ
jgi:hypothetical protein